MRLARSRLVVAVVLTVSATACSSGAVRKASHEGETSSAAVSPGAAAALEGIHALTALGDSVPYGTACDCTPYPQLSGADVGRATDHAVRVANDAVAGAQSGDVVAQLDQPTVKRDVEGSQAVLLEVGANDVGYSPSCGTNISCYDGKIPGIERNLTTIVERVHALTRDRETAVVLLDYWSVWLGGQYAQARGPDYVAAADTVTARVNETIESVARSTGSFYVDLRTAFRGPDGTWDETHLLAPDGDHPNAEGHKRIAQAVASAVAG